MARSYRPHTSPRKVMIVDGYNVIRASERYSELIHDDPDMTDIYLQAREALISDVAAAALNTYDAIIVFDGRFNPHSQGKDYTAAGIHILFSAYKQEADEVIESLAASARMNEREVVVVTSDAATQWTVLKEGVTRVSSRMFLEEVTVMNKEFDDDKTVYSKHTLGDRIKDASVAEKLRRMARGEL